MQAQLLARKNFSVFTISFTYLVGFIFLSELVFTKRQRKEKGQRRKQQCSQCWLSRRYKEFKQQNRCELRVPSKVHGAVNAKCEVCPQFWTGPVRPGGQVVRTLGSELLEAAGFACVFSDDTQLAHTHLGTISNSNCVPTHLDLSWKLQREPEGEPCRWAGGPF